MRLFLQACLGSDVKKELLTYKRILEGETEPVMLFRPRKWGNLWKTSLKEKLLESDFTEANSTVRFAQNNGRIDSPRTLVDNAQADPLRMYPFGTSPSR
jgi:hypothetical protein